MFIISQGTYSNAMKERENALLGRKKGTRERKGGEHGKKGEKLGRIARTAGDRLPVSNILRWN